MDSIATYKSALRERRAAEKVQLSERRGRAWSVARRAAQVLKEQFGAERVVLFGSLTQEERFTEWSDIDIAVWGIAPEDTFRAIGTLVGFDKEFRIDLVDVNICRPALLASVEREGVEL
jgi:uncharacterized protein